MTDSSFRKHWECFPEEVVTSTDGVKGILINVMTEDRKQDHFVFRVYDEKNKRKFKDYEIHHCDLKIELQDSGGCLCEDEEGNCWIAYSPASDKKVVKKEKAE